jgi:two-component system, chemotaxis family, protein-glutamate methylesterase/glutaminase
MKQEESLHVLVIDDSAVVRHTVTALLRPEEGWRVTAAPDPIVGLERIRIDAPDVILLDLEMPRMDGLTFLRHLMATGPIPVVICSGYAEHGTRIALAALEAGAVEIFPKPRLAVKEFLQQSGVSLASVLRRAAAAGSSLRAGWRPELWPEKLLIREPDTTPVDLQRGGRGRGATGVVGGGRAVRSGRDTDRNGAGGWSKTILMGASMGGPEAIRQILSEFPADGPACVVVQHMPERFTFEFARRLDRHVAIEVREAAAGDRVVPGRVLIAPGGLHLELHAERDGPTLQTTNAEPVHGHRPSVDVFFESAAKALGPAAVACVLTGMGEDGAAGLLALARAGASTLVQDRASAVVFGMPGAALDRVAAVDAISLKRMATVLLELARGRASTATLSGAPS